MSQLILNTTTPKETLTLFVNIILPIPIPKLYTYRVPRELEKLITVGSRVIVQFGKKKVLTGIINEVHTVPPKIYEAKYILEILDENPVVNEWQLKLFRWAAGYYMCTVGEVLNAALPSGLKLSSQSTIQLNPEFNIEKYPDELPEKETILLQALKNQSTITYDDVAAVLHQKSIYKVIKSLIDKEAILIFEKIKEKYKPKTVNKIRLADTYVENVEALEKLISESEKRPKQLEILLKYLSEVPVYNQPEKNYSGLDKKIFTPPFFSTSALKTLIKNKVLSAFTEITSRFPDQGDKTLKEALELSKDQKNARNSILNQFESKDIVLLHGITGSGKTEIYIDLIQSVINSGSQVLYLLPEIALTTHIVKRLLKVFGNLLGVYHSKYSDNERVEVWKGIIEGKFPLIVGVRSSVFLPFDNLGLIIIDEEHEGSYKQYDPAPRYHARDLASVLANLHHAKVLLGSATPSLESFYLAKTKKYGYVNLSKRFGEANLPIFEIIDIAKERKKKTLKEDFSPQLLMALEESLANNEQAIIFQNRRGYSPFVSCRECNWVPKCEQCAVSLTYHMYHNELRCHYCGYKEKPHSSCPSCGSTQLDTVGFGTEKLEEDLKILLPTARISRMDLDTTRSKYSYQNILDTFESGETNVLIGTQMLSKGLDFDKVNLVGIVDIDRLIHFPDFRASERTFQLVTQVSGRAGRRLAKGRVFIQTNTPNHPLLKVITESDYNKMYIEELRERKQFHYPPFTRLIKIVLKHTDKQLCQDASLYLYNLLIRKLGSSRVLGPTEPQISKIRNRYLMEILIKLERAKVNLTKAKEIILVSTNETIIEKKFKSLKIHIDVDPY